jgi:hypothetical protein
MEAQESSESVPIHKDGWNGSEWAYFYTTGLIWYYSQAFTRLCRVNYVGPIGSQIQIWELTDGSLALGRFDWMEIQWLGFYNDTPLLLLAERLPLALAYSNH